MRCSTRLKDRLPDGTTTGACGGTNAKWKEHINIHGKDTKVIKVSERIIINSLSLYHLVAPANVRGLYMHSPTKQMIFAWSIANIDHCCRCFSAAADVANTLRLVIILTSTTRPQHHHDGPSSAACPLLSVCLSFITIIVNGNVYSGGGTSFSFHAPTKYPSDVGDLCALDVFWALYLPESSY